MHKYTLRLHIITLIALFGISNYSLGQNCSQLDTTSCSNILDCLFALSFISGDDVSVGPLDLGFTFDIGENSYEQVYVNSNGNLTFETPFVAHNTGIVFPLDTTPIIAPYFSDVNVDVTGIVGWTFIDNFNNANVPAFVTTWFEVGRFGEMPPDTLTNTFQVVLLPSNTGILPDNGNVLFLYGDMNWVDGTAGANRGQVVIDYGDGENAQFLGEGIYTSLDSFSYNSVNQLEYSCLSANTTCRTTVDVLPTSFTTCNDSIASIAPYDFWESYIWNTGDTIREIIVNDGVYNLTVSDNKGCVYVDSVLVNAFEIDTVSTPEFLCPNDLPFNFQADNSTQIQVNGIISNSINGSNVVYDADNEIIITQLVGQVCESIDTQYVFVGKDISVDILNGDLTACGNDTPIQLLGTPAGGDFFGSPALSPSGLFDPNLSNDPLEFIYYRFTDNVGCEYLDFITIAVQAEPEVGISVGSSFCESDNDFTVSVFPNGGSLYLDGLLSTTNTFSPVSLGIGTHTFLYEYIDPNTGCSNSFTITVEIEPSQTVALVNIANSYCQNSGSVELEGMPLGGDFYINGQLILGDILTPSNYNPGTYQVTYSFPNSQPCYLPDTVEISINQSTEPFFLNVPNTVCSYDEPFVVGVSPENGIFTAQDYINSDGQFVPSLALYNQNNIIEYTYTNPEGCSETIIHTIYVSNPPDVTIDINAGTTSFCADDNSNYQLMGTPVGGIFSGNGYVQLGVTPYFRPSLVNTGSVANITYTYTNAQGCESSTTTQFEILEPEIASIGGLPQEACTNGEPIELTGYPVGGVFTGQGITGNIFYPSNVSAGIRTIEYEAFDVNGCSVTTTQNILINQAPLINFSLPDNQFCNNEQGITLIASPSGGFFTIEGSIVETINPTQYSIGTHEVTYTYSNLNCTTSQTIPFEILETPQVEILNTDLFVCDNEGEILLSASPTGGNFIGDYVNNNVFQTNDSGVGVYSVQYQFTDSNTCIGVDEAFLEVGRSPVADFESFYDCEKNTLQLRNLSYGGSGGLTYSWQFNDGNNANSTVEDALWTFSNPDNYSVDLVVQSSNECTDTTSQLVTVPNENVASIVLSDTILTIGDTLNVQGLSPANVILYDWLFEGFRDDEGEYSSHIFNDPGEQFIYLETTDEHGCESDVVRSIFVQDTLDTNFEILNTYPNPTRGNFFVEFYLPKSEYIIIELHNQLGQIVKELELGELNRGVRDIALNLDGLGSGLYFLRFRTPSSVLTFPTSFDKGELIYEQLKFQNYLKVVLIN